MHELVGGANPAERFLTRGLSEKPSVEAPCMREALEVRALGSVAEHDEGALGRASCRGFELVAT